MSSFEEVLLGYDADQARAEARRALGRSFAAATAACPFGVDIDALVRATAAGDFAAAGRAVRAAHPWGGILGRCCHRFCEAAMAASYPPEMDPINLRGLERAASDLNPARAPVTPAVPASGKRVAVVGAGSAGLGAALGLVRGGHAVTLVDALPVLGGMLVAGYPPFRMPRIVLERELPIESPLLQAELRQRVDRAGLERLLVSYDAVCLAIGRFKPAPVRLPGDDLDGVYDALPFLERAFLGTAPRLEGAAVVLGAGYTAQDAARTARRLGASAVPVLYRRGPEDMPVRAGSRETFLRMMEREGAPYRFHLAPVRLLGEGGRVSAVECVRTAAGPPDAAGRRTPVPTSEAPVVLPASCVIKAFGQQPDFSLLPPDVLTDGPFVVHRATQTSRRGLFVAGDVAGDVGNDGAFAGGMAAAAAIHRYLSLPNAPWPSVEKAIPMRARRPGVPLGGD